MNRTPRPWTLPNSALALDERSAEAHASLGWLSLYYRWNWQDSERHYQRALELEPDSAFIHGWYGESLSSQAGMTRRLRKCAARPSSTRRHTR